MNQNDTTILLVPASQRVFYRKLVRWNVVDELVFMTDPLEHPQVRDMIMKTLDHVVVEAVLQHLAQIEHEQFLEECVSRYHDEELLSWLATRVTGIEEILTKHIREAKAELRELLSAELKHD